MQETCKRADKQVLLQVLRFHVRGLKISPGLSMRPCFPLSEYFISIRADGRFRKFVPLLSSTVA